VPDSFIGALSYRIGQGIGAAGVGQSFAKALQAALIGHFGLEPGFHVESLLRRLPVPELLDVVEIVAEEGEKARRYERSVRSASGVRRESASKAAIPDFERKFNELADRHRFGYRLEGGEAERIGSPALSEVIVGPALFASQRPGWDQVERSYREALRHQRGGPDENDDALTAASAALESALKAAGLAGPTLGKLAKEFKMSAIAAPQLGGVPELLCGLLERSAAVRNIHSDVHGRKPGENPNVPQEMVDLSIHLTGAFIVYLERATR